MRALSEVMNVWMKIPIHIYYGLRSAGCSFAHPAKMLGWGTGVTSSKTSAPIRLVGWVCPIPDRRAALQVPWPLAGSPRCAAVGCSPGC